MNPARAFCRALREDAGWLGLPATAGRRGRRSRGAPRVYDPRMGSHHPDPIDETEDSEVEVVFPEDPDVHDPPDMADVHETIPPDGPPVGDVDPDQIIPRWQYHGVRGLARPPHFGPDAQREQQDRAIERYGLARRRPRVVGGLVGLDLGLADRHLGGDDRLGHGLAPSTSSSSATSAASCATSSRRSSRSRTTSMPPASSSSSPTSGCSPRTRAPGTSSSARPTRPRPTAASSPSASARATPRSDDASGSPAATGCPSASSARASPRSCGSTRRRPPSSSAPTSSRPPARPTGRWRPRPGSPRPTSPRSSPTPSTPGGCGPARWRPSRPSSTRRSGRRCRRCASDGGPGHRVAS